MTKTKARTELETYLAQFQPHQLTDVTCPYCSSEFGTLKPIEEDYDTLASCPDCDTVFLKIVKSDGSVITRKCPPQI